MTLAWMYATPVFYDASIMPDYVQNVLNWNPMAYYISFFRSLILYGQIPGANVWMVCALTGIAALAVGLAVFRRLQRNFILYI